MGRKYYKYQVRTICYRFIVQNRFMLLAWLFTLKQEIHSDGNSHTLNCISSGAVHIRCNGQNGMVTHHKIQNNFLLFLHNNHWC